MGIHFTPIKKETEEDTEKAEYIQQILALFFPLYCKRQTNIENGCLDVMMRVLVECIETITYRPAKDILRQINRQTVINYVLWLLQEGSEKLSPQSKNSPPDTSLYFKLTEIILNIIDKGINNEGLKSFCYLLSSPSFNTKYGKEFKKCYDKAVIVSPNVIGPARKDWDKFKDLLKACVDKYEEQNANQPETVEEAEKRNKVFQDLQEEAEEITQKYSQLQSAPMKRKSLSLHQDNVDDSPMMRGKKRKLTNTKRPIQTLEDADSDEDVLAAVSSGANNVESQSSGRKRKRK